MILYTAPSVSDTSSELLLQLNVKVASKQSDLLSAFLNTQVHLFDLVLATTLRTERAKKLHVS